MGFEPTTVRDLAAAHWGTGDSLVSKGEMWPHFDRGTSD